MGEQGEIAEPRPTGLVRLLICDDHRVLTDALEAVVRADSGFELVAPPVHSASDALRICIERHPDVVLMDISFEESMNGIEATSRIRSVCPETRVVIMTAYHDQRFLVEAAEAGASAYLSKTEGAERVLGAARAAASGQVLFDPAELASATAQVGAEREAVRQARDRFDQLTDREREVLEHLTQGATNADIAKRLFLSPHTVQTHVGSILSKLGVRSKTQAVALALTQPRD